MCTHRFTVNVKFGRVSFMMFVFYCVNFHLVKYTSFEFRAGFFIQLVLTMHVGSNFSSSPLHIYIFFFYTYPCT